MLRILTSDNRMVRLDLANQPCHTLLNRMVKLTKGSVIIRHKRGTAVLRLADIRRVEYNDASLGDPWDYENPLN